MANHLSGLKRITASGNTSFASQTENTLKTHLKTFARASFSAAFASTRSFGTYLCGISVEPRATSSLLTASSFLAASMGDCTAGVTESGGLPHTTNSTSAAQVVACPPADSRIDRAPSVS